MIRGLSKGIESDGGSPEVSGALIVNIVGKTGEFDGGNPLSIHTEVHFDGMPGHAKSGDPIEVGKSGPILFIYLLKGSLFAFTIVSSFLCILKLGSQFIHPGNLFGKQGGMNGNRTPQSGSRAIAELSVHQLRSQRLGCFAMGVEREGGKCRGEPCEVPSVVRHAIVGQETFQIGSQFVDRGLIVGNPRASHGIQGQSIVTNRVPAPYICSSGPILRHLVLTFD